MREKPILFSAPMVRAVLAGTKTQTRRVITRVPFPEYWGYFPEHEAYLFGPYGHDFDKGLIKCPYSADRLWVRETWARIQNQDGCLSEENTCPCKGCHTEYKADTGEKYPGEWPDDSGEDAECPKWKPSIHMYRWASRIDLEVVAIRVERLQDISCDDAEAEGVLEWRRSLPEDHKYVLGALMDPVECYATLWNEINEERGLGWDVNPWVWVVEFKRIKP